MNKYQKALKNIEIIKDFIDTQRREAMLGRIKNFSSKYLVKTFQEIHNGYYDIKELVDKATPKKPLKHPSYKFSFIDNIFKQQKLYICPTCRNACLVRIAPNERNENRYCYDCGQAIDWSDEK